MKSEQREFEKMNYLSGEDTSESVESALIGSGHHLGHVHHERSISIAVLDGDSGLIIVRTLVQHLHTVPNRLND